MICVNSVTVYPGSVTLRIGEWYYGAWADVYPTYADCRSVRWYSENNSIASVNATTGYIHANGIGTTRIYAEAIDGSGKKDYITVTVTSSTIYVSSVELNRSYVSIEEGETFNLSATVCPANASNKSLDWCSSNTSVATVSSTGTVTAKSRGYATITATAKDGSYVRDCCDFYITGDILVTSVSLSPSSKTVTVGDSFWVYKTVCPNNATNCAVTWSSSNTSVATVTQSGLVMAQGAGTATITATAQDGSGKVGYCYVTANAPVSVTGIGVYPTSKTMNVGETFTLVANVCPENATNKSVIWSSSDESVATVGTYTGKVTAKKAGTTTITATTVDGGYQDYITIYVHETYIDMLKNLCGFSNTEAHLIRSLYDKVNIEFASESAIMKAWRCARLLSMFNYDGLPWDNVAASVVSLKNAEEYFVNTLGYTTAEYNIIKNTIIEQHTDTSTPDFSHMQYALAARLAYTLDEDDIWSNIFTISTDENVSYLAGWLGDATLKENNGTTSMANDDYCADLDAENVYRLIINGNSAINAMNSYYSNLTSSRTRADVFLQYISYDTVKEKVFMELIDMQLSLLMSSASEQGNFVLVQYYLDLINDEQYHWDTIKSNYPDTYDFLKSLNDGLANMGHYQ